MALGLLLAGAALVAAPAVPAGATASKTLEATFTSGLGIQRAIDQGSLVGTILASPTPASVPVHLLCGGAPDIPTIHDEHTGPSDGVVFIRSCASTRSIGNLRGNVLLTTTNHLELSWAQPAMAQVESWLR